MAIDETVKDFLKRKKDSLNRKKSIFFKYKEEIFYLKREGLSVKDIFDFLTEERKLNITYVNLAKWIKRNETKEKGEINNEKIKSDDDIETISSSTKLPTNKIDDDIVTTKRYEDKGELKKHNLKVNRPKPIE